MAITNAQAIQSLYVAYYNRPADYYGLQFWDKVVTDAKGDTTAVAAAFASSQEYKDMYAGMDTRNTINTIYKNLFGHSADLAGLDFWTNAVTSGAMTLSNAVTQIAKGALGTDLAAYNAKVSAATAFTGALDTTDEILGYAGTEANAAARGFLAGVTDADTLAAAIEPAALNQFVADVTGQKLTGETFDLTLSKDTITGTALNDVINIDVVDPVSGKDGSTLSSADVINGGAGIDTVNIVVSDDYNGTIAGNFSNVEIINIDNSALTGAAGSIDASKFGTAAQTINQIGNAGNVTKLGTKTVASFTDAALTAAGGVTVTAAGANAQIALHDVTGDAATSDAGATVTTTQNRAVLAVDGDALNSVTVTGNVAQADEEGSAASLGLNVAVGTDADGKGLSTLTVNTAVATTLSVANSGSGKGVTSVDTSAGAGAVTFNAGTLTNVATIKTGAGKDVITVTTQTAVDNADTTVNEAANASVSTGAGDDTINVLTTGAGKATIDAGDGKDAITLGRAANTTTGVTAITAVNTGGVTVNAGAGDDTVDVSNVTLTTKDVINGGDGTDTLVVAGKGGFAAGDYLLLDATTSGFETLRFKTDIGGTDAIDASQLAKFTTLAFGGNGSVEEVAATQSLSLLSNSAANSTLTAVAAGYDNSGDTVAYGGNLTVSSAENLGTLALSAATANVAIKASATATAGVADTVTGDLQNLNVALTSVKATTLAGVATGGENLAGVTVDLKVGTAAATLDGLKSVVVTGAGNVTVDATGGSGKLATIDLSGMTAMANLNASGDQVTTSGNASTDYGYQNLSTSSITANNAVAETIKLGGALDHVVTGSTYAKMDTISGFELVASAADATVANAAKSDVLVIDGIAANTVFKAITVTSTTLSGALLEASTAKAAGATGAAYDAVTFVVDGNTYVYVDLPGTNSAANTFDNTDIVVKLTGTYDATLLANSIHGGGVAPAPTTGA